jgi:hypothetical protein
VPNSYPGADIFPLAQLSPLTCFFTIHSCGLWKEVFGDTERLGSAVPAAWEERAITLLRTLPLDCRDRQLIVAVLTLPLAEADQEVISTHESVHSKKVKRDSAVGVCIQHLLKWPSRELDIAQGIQKGTRRFTYFKIQHLCILPQLCQASLRSTSCSSTVEPFLSYLALKSRLRYERYPLIWPNMRIWLSRWAVPARVWTTPARSIIGNCCRNAFKNGISATCASKVAWSMARRCSHYWGCKAPPLPRPFDSFCRRARCTRAFVVVLVHSLPNAVAV